MLNAPPPKKKKMPKIQNFKLHSSFNNFGIDPPREYTWILGEQIWCVLSKDTSFETFTPIYGPMLTKRPASLIIRYNYIDTEKGVRPGHVA